MGTDLDESKVKVKVAQLCPTLCDPTDSTVHGILQTRILEWVAFAFSRVVVKFLFTHLLYLFPPSLFLFSSLSPSPPPFLSSSLPSKNLSQKKLYSQVQCVKQMKMELLMSSVRAETSLIWPPQYSQYDIRGISKKLHFPATRNKFTSQLELDSFQDLSQNREKKNHFLLKMKTPRSTRVKWLVQSHTESARTRARTQS